MPLPRCPPWSQKGEDCEQPRAVRFSPPGGGNSKGAGPGGSGVGILPEGEGEERLVGGSGRHTFRDRMGEKTPLHFACCRGDPKAIIEALESGCNVNAADDVSPLAFQQLATAARECHSPGHLIIPAAARQLAPLDAALRAWRAGAEAGPFPNFSNLIGTGEVKKTHHRGHSTRPVHI